jgi:ATP-binding cassette subfamily B protein
VRPWDYRLLHETVKYFNRKDFEVNRYDETMGRWEGVATKSFTSMTALNFVQGAIIANCHFLTRLNRKTHLF